MKVSVYEQLKAEKARVDALFRRIRLTPNQQAVFTKLGLCAALCVDVTRSMALVAKDLRQILDVVPRKVRAEMAIRRKAAAELTVLKYREDSPSVPR